MSYDHVRLSLDERLKTNQRSTDTREIGLARYSIVYESSPGTNIPRTIEVDGVTKPNPHYQDYLEEQRAKMQSRRPVPTSHLYDRFRF